MEELLLQCQNAHIFPLNLGKRPSTLGEAFRSKSLHAELNKHQRRLFCAEDKALINVLEYGATNKGIIFGLILATRSLLDIRLVPEGIL